MSERDPFENLRDLIDEPVAPRETFADELRSRLMREMSASEASREEHNAPMDANLAPRPPLAFPIEIPRRIRPMVILELAAAAVIILGLVAALSRGWFQNDPEPPTAVPAAILQDDSTATPETRSEETLTPLPTVVPDSAPTMVPDRGADMTLEPTVVPPGKIPNTVWALPLADGERLDFGGMLVDDDTVYRLLATPSFVGVQAVDADTGAVKWQQAHRWAGNLFAIEDDVLYFDGGGNTLTAVDANSGTELWRAPISGNPMALEEEGDRIFVLLNNDMVTALDAKTGDQLWLAQGSVPQEISGGSASVPANLLIAVEGETVAAIASYGVLSGFDVATGEERWSHEGYEAATSSIHTEDDRFIVIDAVGIWVDGEEIDPTGTLAASPEAGSPSAGVITDCANVFVEAGDTTATQGGPTPDVPGLMTSDTLRIQAIDPATGEILWEREANPGAMSAWDPQLVQSPVNTVCAIKIASGQVVAIAAGDGDPDDTLEIGVISDGSFIAGEFDDDAQAASIAIGGMPQSAGNAVIFAVGEDGFAILQLADGTLVKVATGQLDDSDDYHEDRDDDDDGSPESESDD